MKLSKAIAKRIQELREASGLSQQEVATRADLSMSLVAKLEQGKKADPRASTLLALSQALQVPPGRLLENLFPPEPPTPAAPEAAVEPAEAATGAENGSSTKKKKKKGKNKNKKK